MTSDGKFYVRRMAESSTLRLTAIKKPNELSCLPCYFRIVGHASREVSCSPMLACDGESLHPGGWRGLGDNRITRRMDSEGVHTRRAVHSAVVYPTFPCLQVWLQHLDSLASPRERYYSLFQRQSTHHTQFLKYRDNRWFRKQRKNTTNFNIPVLKYFM